MRGQEVLQRESEIRRAGVALGLEERDLIDAALDQAKADISGTVDGRGARGRQARATTMNRARAVFVTQDHAARLNAADVHRQLAVDEHPHVVVTAERELLATVVLKEIVELGGEVKVVTFVQVLTEAIRIVVER